MRMFNKASESKIGEKNPMYDKPAWNRGIKHTSEQIEKIRQGNLKKENMLKKKENNIGEKNKIGKHEKQILDELELHLNKKIIRQFRVQRYFLDGYIPELNLAIEIDEQAKSKWTEEKRENKIKSLLNCETVRIIYPYGLGD